MAETLDTLAERITALTTLTSQMATRVQVDEVKSGLRTQIEAVDAKVELVLEKVDDLIKRDIYHSVVHARFEQRFENHEMRLMTLQSRRKPPDAE